LIEVPSITIVTMMMASARWPSDAEIALATSRMTTRGFAKR
jgi:hypothetical protein